jgi:phosphohistidine swiveling domain-containing protein
MTGQLSDSTTLRPAIIPLAQATDSAAAGHKAATLAALLGAGLPVPDGVVVPVGFFGTSGAGDVPDELVTALVSTIRGGGDVPVAVRSSGIAEGLPHASYAGLYGTVLDVRGDAALREAVSRCWASARAPQVIAYPGAGAATGVAVLVQPMVAAVAAGVAFTADPVTGTPPPLPAWVAPLAFRIVPSLRRRIRSSVAAMRSDVPGTLIRRWRQEWQPDLAARIAALRDVDLAGLDNTRLDEHLREVLALAEHGQLVHFRLHGAIAIMLGELAFTCRDLLGWDEAKTLDLLAGASQMSTVPARALAMVTALAADERFAAAFEAYQREYSCRALRYEMAEPCLDEQPELLLTLIRDQLAADFDPDTAEELLRARRAATRAEAHCLLSEHGPGARSRFDRALDRALAAYPVREDNEFFTTSAPFALLRRTAREIGRRLAARGLIRGHDDAFYLTPQQLRAALRDSIDQHALTARRAGERAWALAHPGPAAYGRPPGPPPPLTALPAEARLANEAFLWTVEQIMGPQAAGSDHRESDSVAAGATMLSGIAACAGSYIGPARIIRSESEFGRLRPGDVLVCPAASPVWSVLFPSIGALVTDTGGLLSHPAIIAREYRLPAVVATGEGTSRLTDEQIVTVDGNAGVVRAFR